MKAQFQFLQDSAETFEFEIKDYIELEYAEYEKFKQNQNADYDFIKDTYTTDSRGIIQCLLVLGKGEDDGILVRSDGKRAICTSYLPGARQILQMEKYPSLKDFANNMESYADTYIERARAGEKEGEFEFTNADLPEPFGDLHFDLNLLSEMLSDCNDVSYANLTTDGIEIVFDADSLKLKP